MKEMKVIVRWEGDPFWLNPDNLLLALSEYCPNTKFECEYIIHPNHEKIKKKYDKKDKKLDKKCLRFTRKYKKRLMKEG